MAKKKEYNAKRNQICILYPGVFFSIELIIQKSAVTHMSTNCVSNLLVNFYPF